MNAFVETEQQAECKKHGPYISKRTTYNGHEFSSSRCPECSAIEERIMDEEHAEEVYQNAIRNSELPHKFFRAEVDSFPDEVKSWMDAVSGKECSGPLVIVGPVGTGKTHLAAAILKRFTKDRRYGLYVSAIDYGRQVRATWRKYSEDSERGLLNRYTQARLLVLDELGANRSADDSIIQDLICSRYDAAMLPATVIVTNLSLSKLSDAIGERAADRIKEGSTVLTLDGESRRRPA